MAKEEVVKETEGQASCVCPFCEGVLEMSAPWCAACGVEMHFCVACEEPLPEDATVCPSCGAECEQ
jgi:hypothetical protein